MNVMSGKLLDGAVALVTGAQGGIGRAICTALIEAGAQVVGTDLKESTEHTNADLLWKHDVTSAESWRQVVVRVQARFSRLDCLINNAGISLVERIDTMSLDQWREVWSVNVEGVFLGMQAALPLLRNSGSGRVGGSSVINISSTAGLRGVALCAAYCASKGAVTLLTKSAAKEFAAFGYPIRVNSIHPSAVDTPMMESIYARYVEFGLSPSIDAAKAAANSVRPLGRMANADDIAGGAVFLCSPAASFITGSELVIDGGITA